MTIYMAKDGTITVRCPKGVLPDKQTLERVHSEIKKLREEAAA